MYNLNRKSLVAYIILILCVMIIPHANVFAQASPGLFFSSNDKPYNSTYGEWTAKWWQWALSIPKDINPAGDDTGKYCGQSQSGPVWFLTGTFGGAATRICTIPTGKAILIPPINAECSYAEYPNLKTESDLRNCAKSLSDKVSQVEFTIDGIKLQNSQIFRVQSPLFSIIFPPGNVYGLKVGNTQGVSDGSWVFLKPLPIGSHEIHAKGVSIDYTTSSINNFVSDVTYHLTVK